MLRETARRAETRERVSKALKLLTTGGVAGQRSGLAILQSTYDSDKLDPDDLAFVRSQLQLFMADGIGEPVDNSPGGADTGGPADPSEDPL